MDMIQLPAWNVGMLNIQGPDSSGTHHMLA